MEKIVSKSATIVQTKAAGKNCLILYSVHVHHGGCQSLEFSCQLVSLLKFVLILRKYISIMCLLHLRQFRIDLF